MSMAKHQPQMSPAELTCQNWRPIGTPSAIEVAIPMTCTTARMPKAMRAVRSWPDAAAITDTTSVMVQAVSQNPTDHGSGMMSCSRSAWSASQAICQTASRAAQARLTRVAVDAIYANLAILS